MYKRTPNTSKLTKAFIESKISQEAIVSKYLNIPMEVVQDCINHGHLIKSVFRDDDYNKSMGIIYNRKRRLKVRDFGGFGFFDDVYGVVAYVLSNIYDRPISTDNKQDFYFVLKHIANTFSDNIEGKVVDENVDEDIIKALSKGRSKKAIIEIAPRPWNQQDKAYWKSIGINLNFLNANFVIPVDQYYINRVTNPDPKYHYKESDPCYAYMLGQNKQGIYLIKLYFPFRDRSKELKFITNCNVLEGLPNLERNDYDYIIITKSSKDRLSIGSHLSSTLFYGGAGDKLNIGVINLPSENYKLKTNEYEWLKNKLNENGLIVSLLDFDTTGRCGAKYLYDNYNIPYIFITRGEFGLYNYGGKDFSDLHKCYSIKQLNQFINETITYAEIKFKAENSQVSYMQRLSEFNLPY